MISMFNVNIEYNLIQGASPFTGVRVLNGATGVVRRSSMIGNTGEIQETPHSPSVENTTKEFNELELK